MKTKPKLTKQSVGLIGLGIVILATIVLFITLGIQYSFDVVLGWFVLPQAILAYLIILLCIGIAIPLIILSKVNKR